MKSLLVLAILTAAGAPCRAQASLAPVEGRAELLDEIEAWRSAQLPRVEPPDPTTAEYEPRLDAIKARVESAAKKEALDAPRRDLARWKADLLRAKYRDARAWGLARGPYASFADESARQAELAAALRGQMRQSAAVRRFQDLAAQAVVAGAAPSAFFDGAEAGGASAGAPAVAAPAPPDPKDPARYAKVRSILISQGARPKVVDAAIAEAIRQNADPLLVLAVVKQESHFDPRARSRVGARGLMQIMPDTGRGLGVRDSGRLYDVRTNLRAGIRYLKYLWSRFTDIDMSKLASMNPFASRDVKSAVAAYNAGPGAVAKYGGTPPYRETQGYVQKVLGYYRQFQQYLGW